LAVACRFSADENAFDSLGFGPAGIRNQQRAVCRYTDEGDVSTPRVRSVGNEDHRCVCLHLRKKLAWTNGGEHYIETIGGRGYVLCDA
jgi:hypothetical protein